MGGAERGALQPDDPAPDLQTPREFFGFAPGRAGHLVDWAGLSAYAHAAAAASDRVRVLELGPSTEGRKLLAVAAGPPALVARCDRPGPVAAGSSVATVVVLCGTHATEAAASQGVPDLLHAAVTRTDPVIARALQSVLLVVVPAVDPDGLDRMVEWLRSTAGRGSGGSAPPGLYRRYAGHDINRDWIMQTQAEIRAITGGVLHRFMPQVVLDLHEMWPTGPRLFLPPYSPPADPAADPQAVARAGALGAAMAERLRARGLAGVATGVVFDAYSPARGYPHYHGAVRILCETATAGLASSMRVPKERLRASGGLDPKVASPAQPVPWPGGPWTAEDVMRYQAEAISACLALVATDAGGWVRWQAELLARAQDVAARPDAYLIPAAQSDPSAAAELRRVLACGGLEMLEGPGGAAVLRAQPYGTWADALLRPQPYPRTRRRNGGHTPYDVTAHCLPALMGVRCERVPAEVARAAVEQGAAGVAAPGAGGLWPAAAIDTYRQVFSALSAGEKVWRLDEGDGLPEGGAFAQARAAAHLPAAWARAAVPLAAPRVAVYASWKPVSDEGWLRYVLDRFEIPHVLVRDADVQRGDLGRCTHLILPSLRGRDLMHGLSAESYGPRYAGGLGERGRQQLQRFVHTGGTLLAVEWSAAWAQSALGLPIRDRAPDGPASATGPSAIVSISRGTGALGLGAPARTWVMYRGGPMFVTPPDACAAAFTGESPAAGMAEGATGAMAGAAAVADIPVGSGRCRLYAFSPYFRAQSWAAMRWLFNALLM